MPALKEVEAEPISHEEVEQLIVHPEEPFNSSDAENRWFGIPKPKSSTVFKYLNYLHKYSTVPYTFFIPFHLVSVLVLPSVLTLAAFSEEDKYSFLNDYYFILKELNSMFKLSSFIFVGLGVHIVSGIILNQWKTYRKNKFIKKEKLLEKSTSVTPSTKSSRNSWFSGKNYNWNAISGRVSIPLLSYHLYLVKFDGLANAGFDPHASTVFEAISDFMRADFWKGTLPFVTLISVLVYHTMFGISRYFLRNRLNPSTFKSKGWYATVSIILTGLVCLNFV